MSYRPYYWPSFGLAAPAPLPGGALPGQTDDQGRPLPAAGPVLSPFQRWQAARSDLVNATAQGVSPGVLHGLQQFEVDARNAYMATNPSLQQQWTDLNTAWIQAIAAKAPKPQLMDLQKQSQSALANLARATPAPAPAPPAPSAPLTLFQRWQKARLDLLNATSRTSANQPVTPPAILRGLKGTMDAAEAAYLAQGLSPEQRWRDLNDAWIQAIQAKAPKLQLTDLQNQAEAALAVLAHTPKKAAPSADAPQGAPGPAPPPGTPPASSDLSSAITGKVTSSALRELGVALLLLSPAILTIAFLRLPTRSAGR